MTKEYVKGDLPEKAAILQRDGETYAIAPHIPGGIVYPETLRKLADIAEKYGAAALKVTHHIELQLDLRRKTWISLGELA